MLIEEKNALIKAGIIIGKIKYKNTTSTIIFPNLLIKFNLFSWPSMKTFEEIFHNTASNSSILVFMDRDVGLRLIREGENDKISVSLSHPMSNYWLSILQPIWDKNNSKIQCRTCNDTGWDGIGYILTCVDCGRNKL